MAAILQYLNEEEVIEHGSIVYIQAVDPDSPNTDFTFRIHRRMSDSPRNPQSDPVIEQKTFTSDSTGAYNLEWNIDAGNFTIKGPSVRYYCSLTVGNSNTYVLPSNNSEDFVFLDRRGAVIHEVVVSLGPIMAIPVYAEVSKDSSTVPRRDFDFTWDNWQTNFKPVVFELSSDSELLRQDQDYAVDYKSGKVIFNENIPPYKEIEASYVFGYFSAQEIMSFCNIAINDINYIPPYTHFSINNFPDYWRSIVVTGAVLRCLEQVFMAPIFRERRLIFSDEDLNGALSSYYERLRSNFEAALQKKNRWSLVSPRGITGHDVIAPPRVSAHNFTQWAYLRGRGF